MVRVRGGGDRVGGRGPGECSVRVRGKDMGEGRTLSASMFSICISHTGSIIMGCNLESSEAMGES